MAVKNFLVVDELASVNAQIKVLEERAAELKGKIIGYGFSSISSEKYKAVVSEIPDSVSVDYKSVAQYLSGKVSAQVYGSAVKKASKVKPGYIRVSLYDL